MIAVEINSVIDTMATLAPYRSSWRAMAAADIQPDSLWRSMLPYRSVDQCRACSREVGCFVSGGAFAAVDRAHCESTVDSRVKSYVDIAGVRGKEKERERESEKTNERASK